MEISNRYNQPVFGMKLTKNACVDELLRYAKDSKQLGVIDGALNKLLSANEGDALIIAGKTSSGQIFSNITLGHRTVHFDAAGANSPAEATFNGILDLATFGKKFRSLVGGDPKIRITEQQIINRYTV